ncbi:30S ribosomal protein S6 [Methyloligella solikamskensis]|uniref:Small ribosomal subunit protein bS6 n=1 Tax=Methyloligella solikamskensis TaxID=1177756 RepID=A0ABW3JBM3_9HYPH
MPLYEHVVLARQDISGQQVDTLVDELKKIVEDNGGSVGKTENWGLKSIAYRIKKNRKAHYALMNIDAPIEAMTELERQERLHQDIIRVLTIRVDELEEGPSAQMRRSDDRDSRGRGDRGDRGDRRGPPRDRGDRDRDRSESKRDDRETSKEDA